LNNYDPEFADFFKVAADFASTVNRENTSLEYARALATIARREHLRPLNQAAVARVIEHSARLTGHASKLLTHMRTIKDLLTEADYWADENHHKLITANDVQQAIDHKCRRLDRIREQTYEAIHRGSLMINTHDSVIGQINGLSVIQLGDFCFGQPSRITATTRMGNGKVVDIERETELGGAIHSKGVLILTHYIAARYARLTPFSLSASLVFEQSYGQIEGDSASMAELCALLSSIAQIPMRQDLAITGSMNQLGHSQPIGGVNEKIEGFFDICKVNSLSGTQGVIIPDSNIPHLMLRQDLIEAVEQGQFHIYSVSHVDEALSLLSTMPAGIEDTSGVFPSDSFNGRVDSQLRQFTSLNRTFAEGQQRASGQN
jgi:predicted ATP-dependent protease